MSKEPFTIDMQAVDAAEQFPPTRQSSGVSVCNELAAQIHTHDPTLPASFEEQLRELMARPTLADIAAELPNDETVEDLALEILHDQASDDEDTAIKIARAVLRQCHDFIVASAATKALFGDATSTK